MTNYIIVKHSFTCLYTGRWHSAHTQCQKCMLNLCMYVMYEDKFCIFIEIMLLTVLFSSHWCCWVIQYLKMDASHSREYVRKQFNSWLGLANRTYYFLSARRQRTPVWFRRMLQPLRPAKQYELIKDIAL